MSTGRDHVAWMPVALAAWTGRRHYQTIAEIVAGTARLRVPTLAIMGEVDACDPPSESAEGAAWLDGAYHRVVLPGICHLDGHEAAPLVVHRMLAFHDRIVRKGDDAVRSADVFL